MSRLGNLIIEHGPYEVYELIPNRVARFLESAEFNALRDELIKLRAIRARLPEWANAIDEDFDWSKGHTQAAIGDMLAAATDQPGGTTAPSIWNGGADRG